MLTYQNCESLLNRKKTKKLNHNTRLLRKGNDFTIILHLTEIITIQPDNTFTLNAGTWRTATTKNRLNEYSPVTVFQKNKIWFVKMPNGEVAPFEDGMKVKFQ